MIIDHLTISVSHFERSCAFYERALQPLGITTLAKFDGFAGMGKTRPQFWFAQGEVNKHKTHIAFAAATRAEVDAFYRAAMAAGGKDNGPPGIRANYHPDYYAAFVIDPDGHNIEAVCHRPEA